MVFPGVFGGPSPPFSTGVGDSSPLSFPLIFLCTDAHPFAALHAFKRSMGLGKIDFSAGIGSPITKRCWKPRFVSRFFRYPRRTHSITRLDAEERSICR